MEALTSIDLSEAFFTQLGIPSDAVDWELLKQALTHVSYSQDYNNERLEFLGDSVLKLAAAEFLMERYPQATVGEMTALRSHLISDQTLTHIAEKLGLDPFIQASNSALKDPGTRPKRLADALEAILGVLYLSRGNLSLVRLWLDQFLEPLAEELRANPVARNPKMALQELVQKWFKRLPEYRTVALGKNADDFHEFAAEVWFGDRCLGKGRGTSRKAAEQAAALEGYATLQSIIISDESEKP